MNDIVPTREPEYRIETIIDHTELSVKFHVLWRERGFGENATWVSIGADAGYPSSANAMAAAKLHKTCRWSATRYDRLAIEIDESGNATLGSKL